MKPTLRILAVDDHQLFLQGLSDCLRLLPQVSKVVNGTNIKEMNAILANWIPDIIFLDLNLRDDDGFNICREIKRRYESIFVIILTHYDLKKFVEKAKTCGADAYFIKNTDAEGLAKFIQHYSEGKIREFHVHIPHVANLQSDIFKNDLFELTRTLSKREREVMDLIVRGWDHLEIEKLLNITYDTFKSHRASILLKLNVKNIAELVLLTMRGNPESVNGNRGLAG